MTQRSLLRNSLANIAGRIGTALISLLLVPVFVHLLGAEAYGLIYVFAALQIMFSFLDLGMTAAASREVASNVALGREDENKGVLRTFEILYWSLGALLGVALLLGSGYVATNWVNPKALTGGEVRLAVAILAISITVRWPVSLYMGVLIGLEKQVLQNAIQTGAAALRGLGALVVLVFVSRTISAFLIWQVVANLVEVGVFSFAVRKRIGAAPGGVLRFTPAVIVRVWRYSLAFNMASVLGMILLNADRIILMKLRPLEEVAYYGVASTAAGAISILSFAVSFSTFPRFSARFAVGDMATLETEFHKALQSISFLSAGVALSLALFPRQILGLWVRSDVVSERAATTLSLLALAGLLFSIQGVANALLGAIGRLRPQIVFNALGIALYLPLMFLLVPRRGIEGAAALYLTLNVLFTMAYTVVIGRSIFPEGIVLRLLRDVVPYTLLGGAWVGGAKALLMLCPGIGAWWLAVLILGGLGYIATSLAISGPLHLYPYGWKGALGIVRSVLPGARGLRTERQAE